MADRARADRLVPLTGWGRATTSGSRVVQVPEGGLAVRAAAVGEALEDTGPRGVLARGMGRSYGDAALNSGGAVLRLPPGRPVVDPVDGTAVVPGGTTLSALVEAAAPTGWLPAVLPGTGSVSLGGAVASDVHGKNHVAEGTIARHLREIVLVDGTGTLHRLGPDDERFRATTGGMGLTGVVLQATVQLVRAPSTWMRVHTRRLPTLDAVMDAVDAGARTGGHSVAWLDTLRGGRGVVSVSRMAEASEVPAGHDPFVLVHPRRLTAPPWVPGGLLTVRTIRAFNAAHYGRAPDDEVATVDLLRAHHPLDAVRGWNRMYGPAGFVQYQLAVPDSGVDAVPQVLSLLQDAGVPSFLAVLKRFGAAGDGHLSFPIEGWTLALDVPVGGAGLAAALDRADEVVAAAGGRVYLTKDARLRPDLVRTMYPRWSQWLAVRDCLDPERRFASDLGRRLRLAPEHAGDDRLAPTDDIRSHS